MCCAINVKPNKTKKKSVMVYRKSMYGLGKVHNKIVENKKK